MHIKRNNNETRTYLQGLRRFDRSLPKNVKNLLKRNSYNYSEIMNKWENLISGNITKVSYPKSIKIDPNNNKNVLVLSIKRGNEILIEYSKKEIINKINSYFGYNYLNEIRLVSDNSEKKIKKIKTNKIFSEKIEEKISKIENKNIHKAFSDLIRVIRNI
tara:strand:+ start:7390 stop:7869 length:480 start_codon:yes stop_codon:yes gene_type:complete